MIEVAHLSRGAHRACDHADARASSGSHRAPHPLSSAVLVMSVMLNLGCVERDPHTRSVSREVTLDPTSSTSTRPLVPCSELERLAIFERRVLPLIDEGASPTCARCHLPGVNFRPFIKESECQTLACMEEESLIDLDQPESSKMLSWIARGHEALDRSLEEDPLALAEHQAILSWVEYQAQCRAQLCEERFVNPCEKLIRPPRPDQGTESSDLGVHDMDLEPDMELIPCSEAQLVHQFTAEVWPLHGRCYHCHSDSYSAASTQAPRPAPWMSDDRERLGARIASERIRAAGYLNLDEPAQSLILLKPLSVEAGGTIHGGGTKMRDLEDPLYVPLLAWIEHVAACQGYVPPEESAGERAGEQAGEKAGEQAGEPAGKTAGESAGERAGERAGE